MIIDANMYWMPEELFENEELLKRFLADIPGESGWYGCTQEVPGTEKRRQIVLEKPPGYQNLNYVQHDYILEHQLKDMDCAGVDKAVLKTPCCQEWMSLEMCRFFNDRMSEYSAQSKGRLIPLAVVPPDEKQENIDELARCHEQLGMNGLQLSAHYGADYLDHERFAGFFKVVNELGMTVYVHHTPVPAEYQSFYEYNNVRRSYGRCVDQGLAVSRELFSGFFDKYPNIRMVHSMLGGGFFAVSNMLFPAKAKKEAVSRFQSDNRKIEEQFKKNIFFEMSHAQPWGKIQLESAIRILGAEHVIFGTSYPVRREWLLEGVDFVRNLDITEEEKRQVLGGNAQRLYKA
ncbi:amidohydrolase family protein [Parablautia muri]|uniref:Amidohydrolase n=1 Tax=Parablautia muri TaxID=2320879 RepID=A0A9X5GS83_9FIRM|nr:amidohydrolase family protein [Parablautia muri]NBJ92876.1 amidohydrolase [Parablautia muri]